MLNLKIAMLPLKYAFVLIGIFFALAIAGQVDLDSVAISGVFHTGGLQLEQDAQKAVITSPAGGSALQGVITISGTTDVSGFRSAEITFAYPSDPTGTWFLIQQSDQPVKEGSLATWDTTTITDGDYRLRLQVMLQGGEVQEFVLSGLRVRNYTSIETSTPEAGVQLVLPTLTPSPLPDFQVTPRSPTPLPTNPAEVTNEDLQKSMMGGVLGVLAALALGGIYIDARRMFRP